MATVLSFKRNLIGAGFAAMRATGLHRMIAAPGLGFILTLHRVRPFAPPTPGYAPNRLLEVTPEFLDAALSLIAARGFEFVTLRQAARRLSEGGPPFAALTFDDGYRDTRDIALPLLERHGAPATVFFAPGLIERTARLWWLELEEAIRRLDAITLAGLRLPARTPAEKSAAFERVYWTLRARPEAELLDAIAALAAKAGVSSAALAEPEFMTWDETLEFARHPLVSIGAHSLQPSPAGAMAGGSGADGDRRLQGGAGGAARPAGHELRLSRRRPDQRGAARVRARPPGRLRERGDDAAGHVVRRARGPPPRFAARLAQRAVAGCELSRRAAERRAVSPMEPGPPAQRRVSRPRSIQTISGSIGSTQARPSTI